MRSSLLVGKNAKVAPDQTSPKKGQRPPPPSDALPLFTQTIAVPTDHVGRPLYPQGKIFSKSDTNDGKYQKDKIKLSSTVAQTAAKKARRESVNAKLQETKTVSETRREAVTSFREATGFRRSDDVRVYLSEPPAENASDLDRRRWQVAVWMDSAIIKAFLVLAILSNAVLIGVQADYGGDPRVWNVVEVVFLMIFTLELGLNIFAFGKLFFGDAWNLIDFVVVAFSLVDFFMTVAGAAEGGSGLSVVRLIRVLRVLRVISFLEKLAYLVAAFGSGMMNAGWVLLLMVLALYVFAVMGKSMLGDSERLKYELEQTHPDIKLAELFGSIPKCFITFICFFTFDNALGIQRAIADIYPASWLFFILFLVIVSVGILELLTAIFIDSLLEEKRAMEKQQQKMKSQQREEVQRFIAGMYQMFDEGGKGMLGDSEIKAVLEFLEEEETVQLLQTVGIECDAIKEAVRLSDVDGDGLVSKDEFTQAMAAITEKPTKADIRDLRKRITANTDGVAQMRTAAEDLDGKIKFLNMKMDSLGGTVTNMASQLTRMENLLLQQKDSSIQQEKTIESDGTPTEAEALAPEWHGMTLQALEALLRSRPNAALPPIEGTRFGLGEGPWARRPTSATTTRGAEPGGWHVDGNPVASAEACEVARELIAACKEASGGTGTSPASPTELRRTPATMVSSSAGASSSPSKDM